MRLLLDECIPRRLKNSFTGHQCQTVAERGWAGKQNGELLSLAEADGFEVFLTIDQGLEYQLNLSNRNISIIFIRTRSKRISDLVPFVPGILTALSSVPIERLISLGRAQPR